MLIVTVQSSKGGKGVESERRAWNERWEDLRFASGTTHEAKGKAEVMRRWNDDASLDTWAGKAWTKSHVRLAETGDRSITHLASFFLLYQIQTEFSRNTDLRL
jgi:hypothetical protein